MSCRCGGAAARVPAQVFYRREPFARREHCCAECSQGIAKVSGAAGYFYPGGGDAASDAAAQRAREAQAAREAADRDAALRGVSTVTGGVQTVVSETQATERARIEAEARLAATRAEAQAATERARIEAQRDLELARVRASTPAPLEVMPLASTTPATTPAPTVTPRTDSGAGTFPVVPVAIGAAVVLGGLIYFGSKKKGRR